jgi:hypothetical protein
MVEEVATGSLGPFVIPGDADDEPVDPKRLEDFQARGFALHRTLGRAFPLMGNQNGPHRRRADAALSPSRGRSNSCLRCGRNIARRAARSRLTGLW